MIFLIKVSKCNVCACCSSKLEKTLGVEGKYSKTTCAVVKSYRKSSSLTRIWKGSNSVKNRSAGWWQLKSSLQTGSTSSLGTCRESELSDTDPGPCIWTLGPELAVLSGKVVEPGAYGGILTQTMTVSMRRHLSLLKIFGLGKVKILVLLSHICLYITRQVSKAFRISLELRWKLLNILKTRENL